MTEAKRSVITAVVDPQPAPPVTLIGPRQQILGPEDYDELQRMAEQFIAKYGVTKVPKRAATAPPIAEIRQALKYGVEITFKRGRSGRTVTFKLRTETKKGQAAPSPCRRRRRSYV
jgi:hypothetical protein